MPESLLAPPLDRVQLEKRRSQAIEFFTLGWSQAHVARQLRVSRTSASRWHGTWKAGGSLARRVGAGRPSQLPRQAVAALYRAGMTASQLRERILDEHGVQYSSDHVGRLMLRLKLRPPMRIHGRKP